jgi:hypothetical protein
MLCADPDTAKRDRRIIPLPDIDISSRGIIGLPHLKPSGRPIISHISSSLCRASQPQDHPIQRQVVKRPIERHSESAADRNMEPEKQKLPQAFAGTGPSEFLNPVRLSGLKPNLRFSLDLGASNPSHRLAVRFSGSMRRSGARRAGMSRNSTTSSARPRTGCVFQSKNRCGPRSRTPNLRNP